MPRPRLGAPPPLLKLPRDCPRALPPRPRPRLVPPARGHGNREERRILENSSRGHNRKNGSGRGWLGGMTGVGTRGRRATRRRTGLAFCTSIINPRHVSVRENLGKFLKRVMN